MRDTAHCIYDTKTIGARPNGRPRQALSPAARTSPPAASAGREAEIGVAFFALIVGGIACAATVGGLIWLAIPLWLVTAFLVYSALLARSDRRKRQRIAVPTMPRSVRPTIYLPQPHRQAGTHRPMTPRANNGGTARAGLNLYPGPNTLRPCRVDVRAERSTQPTAVWTPETECRYRRVHGR